MKPPLFSCLTSRVANNGSLYGRFLFGPLPIDISLTVATVLRRSLLHSQATFTIVSAEIEGATHEYASLPGIQESVLEILLNLGEIVLTSTQRNLINPNFRTSIGTSPFFFANIRVSGPGIITAKDINWPKGIFCVKPNSVICTLSSNETLTMRLKIACSLNKNKNNTLYENEIETKLAKPYLSRNSFEQVDSKELKPSKGQNVSFLPMPLTSGHAPVPMTKGQGHGQMTGGQWDGQTEHQTHFTASTASTASTTSTTSTTSTSKGQVANQEEQAQAGTWTYTQSAKNLSISSQENKQDPFTNNQNQFEFFKLQEKKSTTTSVNSLEKKIKTDINTTPNSLNESHFIRIQKKNLISSKAKETETSKGNSVLLYQQTIEATQRLLTKHTGFLDSYSIRKKKAKLTPVNYSLINKETIFYDNKSQSTINSIKSPGPSQASVPETRELYSRPHPEYMNIEMSVQKQDPTLVPIPMPMPKGIGQEHEQRHEHIPNLQDTQKGQIVQTNQKNQENQETEENQNKQDQENQDLEKNVTFRIFPGLFNDFKQSSKLDPFLKKKENKKNDKEQEDQNQLELDISNNIQDIKQENLFSSTEINNTKKVNRLNSKSFLSGQKFKQESTIRRFKHELLVSSSSYPVEKVNFLIERDDELAGYRHRIILEVWTNGSISPRQAIFESIGSIIKLIYNFREPLRNSFS